MNDTSVLEQNKRVVTAFIDDLSANRYDEAWALVRPDAELWILTERRVISPAQYAEMYDQLITTRFVEAGVKITIEQLTAEEDRVAARCESYGEMKNGRVYNNLYHFLFQLEDGLIVKLWEFSDSHHARTVLRAPDPE